jgi:hypothetical protein
MNSCRSWHVVSTAMLGLMMGLSAGSMLTPEGLVAEQRRNSIRKMPVSGVRLWEPDD